LIPQQYVGQGMLVTLLAKMQSETSKILFERCLSLPSMNESGRRILIADDKAAARFALKGFLQKEPDLDVVDEAADIQELLAQAKATCPDLIFLDWDLPGAAEAGLISALRQADCQPRVIVLSVRPESAAAALGAGADGFVYKGDGPKQLLTVIRSVLKERTGRMSTRPREA